MWRALFHLVLVASCTRGTDEHHVFLPGFVPPHALGSPTTTNTWQSAPRRPLSRTVEDANDNTKCRSTGLRGRYVSSMASTEVGGVEFDVENVKSELEYRPDRDTESQAYESAEGWTLRYHDLKTRRDVSDARAKVTEEGHGFDRLRWLSILLSKKKNSMCSTYVLCTACRWMFVVRLCLFAF